MKKAIVSALAILALLLPLRAQTVESNLVDAVSLYSNGQYAKAQRILQTLSVASPESDAVWYYLAQTQLRQKDISGAEASLEKAVALMRRVGYARTDLKLYPGMRHEILNETGRLQVWEDILAQIGQR